MIRRALLVLAAVLGLTVALQGALHSPDPSTPWWHRVPGFFAVYGVVGCVVLVAVAKLFGKLGLQKPEEREPDEDRREEDEG